MDAEELLRRYAAGDRDLYLRSLPSLVKERNPKLMNNIQLTNEEVKLNCAVKIQLWAITGQLQCPHR